MVNDVTSDTFKSEFIDAYFQAALWSSTGYDDEPLDANYNDDDFSGGAIAKGITDCEEFIKKNMHLLKQVRYNNMQYSNAELAGHDFWLTRCGHGAGFWDRGLDAIGDALTAYSEGAGNVEVYVSDKNELEFT